MLPIVTMRSYAEEKRSGTIELLLTAPLTDLQIILGKFTGAMGLYASMLLVTALSMGALFFFGTPEVKPLLATYLGLLLMGGCFVSVGLLISSFTSNQIVAGAVTFGVFLILWVINWPAPFAPWPWLQTFLNYASIVDHFDDFSRGVLDTKHVVYYISFIAVGLFLTARSVDTERWRG
jgi:ABC-2 type transport system permease protein